MMLSLCHIFLWVCNELLILILNCIFPGLKQLHLESSVVAIMSETPMLNSPSSVTTVDNAFAVGEKGEKNKRVRMKKQLGLLEGVAIIIGIIFGSGNLHISVLTHEFIFLI
jgi:hypothetical protein